MKQEAPVLLVRKFRFQACLFYKNLKEIEYLYGTKFHENSKITMKSGLVFGKTFYNVS